MDVKQWVENWKRVGPILEKIEAKELRAQDNAEVIRHLMPMIDWCIERTTPETTSGLVEQQRLFQKLRKQMERKESTLSDLQKTEPQSLDCDSDSTP